MGPEGSFYFFLIRVLWEADRVVHVDPGEHDDPIDDLVRALGGAAEVTVRYCDPAHLQCAVERTE